MKILACIMGCMLTISNFTMAQDTQRIPDSVSVDDTISFEKKSDVTVTTIVDSVKEEKISEEDSVVFRVVPDSVIAAYKKDPEFRYANDQRYWIRKPVVHEKNFWDYLAEWAGSKLARSLLILLLVSVLIFALYKIIAENKLYMFYSAPKKISDQIPDVADMGYDVLEQKIQDAVQTGDFRNAMRYLHLKALKKAGDKELIHFHAQGTNQEYMNQMSGHPGEKDFRFLTNVYEYVWYGGFTLSPAQFASLKEQFSNLYNTIDR